MLLCLKCCKVYNQKTIKNNQCKVKECFGEVVEIDELFIPVIAELNKKGYKTRACCSGHLEKGCINSYIYFYDDKIPSTLPKEFLFDQDLYPWVNWGNRTKNCIRKLFDSKKNINDLSKDIFKNAISVLEWAEELENLNGV